MTTLSKEYNEGYSAFFKSGVRNENPYPPGSSQADDYESGWSQAMKLHSHLLPRRQSSNLISKGQEEALLKGTARTAE